MHIGITFDLKERYLQEGYAPEVVAELDAPETIDAIEDSIRLLGHTTERIGNIKELVAALSLGYRWDLIFNIAEGVHGLCREAQIPALLDAYRIPYVFSDSFTLVATLHKGWAKAIVREKGVPTADYRVVERSEDLTLIDLPFPLFVKPVGGGTGAGIDGNSIVWDWDQLRITTSRLLSTTEQPVLVETYLSGREFTVGVVGTGMQARAIGVMEISIDATSDHGIYSYQTKKQYLDCVTYHPVDKKVEDECVEVALGAWRALGCRDGGRIDVRMDSVGRVNFIEVNPLAGLHPIDSDLPILAAMQGVSYSQLIGLIIDSAIERLGLVDDQKHSVSA